VSVSAAEHPVDDYPIQKLSTGSIAVYKFLIQELADSERAWSSISLIFITWTQIQSLTQVFLMNASPLLLNLHAVVSLNSEHAFSLEPMNFRVSGIKP